MFPPLQSNLEQSAVSQPWYININIDKNGIGEKGSYHLIKAVWPQLKELKLSNNI